MTQTETDRAAQALETLGELIDDLYEGRALDAQNFTALQMQLNKVQAESHRAWMARNHLMRKLTLPLGANSVWTPEEIDAALAEKGVVVSVTKPTDKPPPSPFTALLAALDLKPDKVTAAAKTTLERWYAAQDRYPNMDRLSTGRMSKLVVADKATIEIKEFRELKNGTTTEMVMGWVDKDPARARRVARWLLNILSTMVDRSLPLTTGGYSPSVTAALKRGVDQPGVRRFVTAHDEKRMPFMGGDYVPLEFDLALYTLVLKVYSCWSSRHLGGEVEQAYQEGLAAAVELEGRKAYLASVFEKGKPRWAYMHNLAHAAHANFMSYRLLYLMTGDKIYSEAADELRGYVRDAWVPVTLPGGLEGMATPHKLAGLMKRLGRENTETTWHNSVYLEETCGSMTIDAMIGGADAAWTFDDIRKLGNTLYHTLPQYGWDGSKTDRIAGNMGGGGIAEGEKRRDAIRFTDGTEIPAKHDLGGWDKDTGEADHDGFLGIQRGHTFLPAAWSDIADYRNKLPLVAKGAEEGRGTINLAIYLCELRREGKLPGVVT